MCQETGMAEGKILQAPNGKEDVEAGDTGSEGDQTANANDNVVYSLHLICTVLSNTLNTIR